MRSWLLMTVASVGILVGASSEGKALNFITCGTQCSVANATKWYNGSVTYNPKILECLTQCKPSTIKNFAATLTDMMLNPPTKGSETKKYNFAMQAHKLCAKIANIPGSRTGMGPLGEVDSACDQLSEQNQAATNAQSQSGGDDSSGGDNGQ